MSHRWVLSGYIHALPPLWDTSVSPATVFHLTERRFSATPDLLVRVALSNAALGYAALIPGAGETPAALLAALRYVDCVLQLHEERLEAGLPGSSAAVGRAGHIAPAPLSRVDATCVAALQELERFTTELTGVCVAITTTVANAHTRDGRASGPAVLWSEYAFIAMVLAAQTHYMSARAYAVVRQHLASLAPISSSAVAPEDADLPVAPAAMMLGACAGLLQRDCSVLRALPHRAAELSAALPPSLILSWQSVPELYELPPAPLAGGAGVATGATRSAATGAAAAAAGGASSPLDWGETVKVQVDDDEGLDEGDGTAAEEAGRAPPPATPLPDLDADLLDKAVTAHQVRGAELQVCYREAGEAMPPLHLSPATRPRSCPLLRRRSAARGTSCCNGKRLGRHFRW